MTRRERGAILTGVVLTALLVATARTPEAGTGWRLAFVGLHLVAAAASALAVWRLPLSRRAVLWGAVLFRLCALPMLPTLSDDGYRYLWDGLVAVEAETSPYRYRPSDPALEAWHGRPEYERMNSQDYYSVYPPASQLAFAAAAGLSSGPDWRSTWWLWKVLMVLAELVAVVALLRVVGPALTALYAWSPLAVVEIAGQGHTEALVLLGLAATLTASRRPVPLASLGVALAGAVKLYPLALLPQAWRRDGWTGVLASSAALGVLSVPLWAPDAVAHVSESLGLFFGTFDEYAAPYRLLKAALYPLLGEGAGRAASAALGGVFALAVGLTWLTDDGTARSMRLSLAVVVLGFAATSAVLHPWYWTAALFALPLLQSKTPIWWTATWSTASYLEYVLPGSTLPVLVIGWGGGLALAWHDRRQTPMATAPRPEEPGRPWPTPRPAKARPGTGGTT